MKQLKFTFDVKLKHVCVSRSHTGFKSWFLSCTFRLFLIPEDFAASSALLHLTVFEEIAFELVSKDQRELNININYFNAVRWCWMLRHYVSSVSSS